VDDGLESCANSLAKSEEQGKAGDKYSIILSSCAAAAGRGELENASSARITAPKVKLDEVANELRPARSSRRH
jgi:hypothetical protein